MPTYMYTGNCVAVLHTSRAHLHTQLKCDGYNVFLNTCMVAEREPHHPIKVQKDLNSALSLAHKVDVVTTDVARTWKNAVYTNRNVM